MSKMWQWVWFQVWEFSEFFRLPLGRFAPWVFNQMMGQKGKIKERKNNNER
jgi:hypothetical protein